MTLRLATFNVENLFERARALNTTTWAQGQPALRAFERFNTRANNPVYSDADKQAMLEALETLHGHVMLVDGNDPRGIDIGLFCDAAIEVASIRSHVDVADPATPGHPLLSRDCPVYQLRLPGGADRWLVLNHLKSQSFTSGNPDPLRSRQSAEVRHIYDQLRDDGAELIAVMGLERVPRDHQVSPRRI